MYKLAWLFFAIVLASLRISDAASQDGPKDAVVIIIRHAEDAPSGRGLSSQGEQRAEAYKDYFLNFAVDSKRLEPEAIFAANDSLRSYRPRLTVEPFAKAAKLGIDTRFHSTQSAELVATLRETQDGKRILICWRHRNIPNLLRALGANPENLLPNGRWPGKVYDWVILLRYDQNGGLIPGSPKRINEHLLPGDTQ
jgi:hypothetical protein